ncbi:MAG: hypothetical protein HYU64_11290 [Armatimonadetes bacterium]|nr:hypothetical protein [Armatimonadota bacterium]
MKKGGVLLITYKFPPSGGSTAIRAALFAKYLPFFDITPTVVAGPFMAGDPRDEGMAAEMKGVAVHRPWKWDLSRLTAPLEKRLPIIRRLLNFFFGTVYWISWTYAVRGFLMRLVGQGEKPNAVFLTAPPFALLLLAETLKRKYHDIPLVLDMRDEWTINPFFEKVRSPWKSRVEANLEARAFRFADKITCATQPITEDYMRKYPEWARKFETLWNGYDPEAFNGIACYRKTPALSIVYAGSLGQPGLSSTPFLRAVEKWLSLHPDRKKQLRVKFYGKFFEDREYWTVRLGECIEFHPHLPYREIVQICRQADFLLLTFENTFRGKHLAPCKLFEYIAARRPMLSVIPKGESGARALIEQYRLGTIADVEKEQEILEALDRVWTTWQAGDFPNPDLTEPLERFSRKNLAKRLAEIFREVSRGPACP